VNLHGAIRARQAPSLRHPDYVRFATHYRFRPDFCQARDPQSKGIVENLVGYAKRDLMVPLAAGPGADGLTLLPYFDGERTPVRPDATGVLHGLTTRNATPENLARAAERGLDVIAPFNAGYDRHLQAAGRNPADHRIAVMQMICVADSASPPLPPAAVSPRSPARRLRPRRPSPPSPIPRCAASAIRSPLQQA